jgi:Putative transposase
MHRRELLFNLLFASASATLLELGRDPKHLGAELGVTMVLHTWTRDLSFHPHVHAIVTGGGLSPEGRWRSARHNFLFHVKVIGALFRGKFLDALQRAHTEHKLVDPNDHDHARIRRQIAALYDKNWVVYAKRPFGGAEQVIRYLGRYTHRVGISNARLVAIDDHGVTFRTRGTKTATLPPDAFLHRFLTHVLPPRFVKIRHYGLFASGNVRTHLVDARRVLEAGVPASPRLRPAGERAADWASLLLLLTNIDVHRCPACKVGLVTRLPLALPESRAPPRNAG